MPWDHPLNLGGGGATGTLAANRTLAEADLIIAVGTRLSDFTTASKTAFANPEAQVLSINVASYDAVKMDALPLVADARLALQQLSDMLASRNYRAAFDRQTLHARKRNGTRKSTACSPLIVPKG